MDRRRRIGQLGEDAAAAHLERQGFEIIDRNFRTRYGELDIVALDRRCLVFCEVRARSGACIDLALESIGAGKQTQLRKMASEWFRMRPRSGSGGVRFDAVAVGLDRDGSVLAIEHVVGAF